MPGECSACVAKARAKGWTLTDAKNSRCLVINVSRQAALGLSPLYILGTCCRCAIHDRICPLSEFSHRYGMAEALADPAASLATSAAPAAADASKAADVEVSLSLLRRQHEDLERELAASGLMSAIALKEQAPKLLDAPSCVGVRFHHDCRAHTRLTRATPLFGLAADS
jgi:hypothetical protein